MPDAPFWPFIVLLIGIATVVVLIVVIRLHAFLALMIAAVVVGLLSGVLPGDAAHLVKAVELPMREFGVVAGQIAFVIALAAIVGTAMLESGAADRIVTSMVGVFGEGRAAIALILSSFILAIPVFFDTVFFLLIPLAQALRQRTGKDYAFFVVAIAGGAAITHHLVPPTPGPLIMAETLQLDLGLTIMAGFAAGLIPAVVVYFGGQRIGRSLTIPFHPPTVPDATPGAASAEGWTPSLAVSFVPVVLPVALISLSTLLGVMGTGNVAVVDFVGNKNVAMFLGTVVALWLWAKRKGMRIRDVGDAVGTPLQIAGIIILITCAGGAFGAMIRLSGIADAVSWATAGFQINYIVLAWLIAAVMKIAQGSGTVSMITTSSIMFAILGDGAGLPYHPMYVLLAIGFGSMVISWMNDSGFWVVAKLGGLTERETLRTWTTMLGILGVVGLVQLLIVSALFPLV